MKSLRTGGCHRLLLLSHPPTTGHHEGYLRSELEPDIHVRVHWHDFLYQLVNLPVSPGFPSPPWPTKAKEKKRRNAPENNTRPSLSRSAGHQTCLSRPIYFLFAPLILEWWHRPLYLQWIKTETDASSSSGNPSPKWMGFRWPLMHPVVKLWQSSVLCFHVVSNPQRMGTKSPVSFGGLWWLIPPQSVVCTQMRVSKKGVGSSEGQPAVTTGTSCIQHWNDTGELPHLDKHSRIFFFFLHSVLGFVQFHLCQRPVSSALTETEIYSHHAGLVSCSDMRKPPHFGHVCKLILSTGSVSAQIGGQSEDSTIIWLKKKDEPLQSESHFFLLTTFC